MSKKKNSAKKKPPPLSELARTLLAAMVAQPSRIEYNTRVLGGSFREADIGRLDQAYAELAGAKFVEPAGAVVSFFGSPKLLYRVTMKGTEQMRGTAA